ncbi:MAG: RHS repeat-associated core domain-containing protein [Gammaproteobacteria bacterium]|nr:RHS repeat-associated core domain-containing protein [Gammaproteobacteria bacterium]
MDTVEGWASYMTVGGSTWIAIMGLTGRGFTGHQHVDRLDLIHMNGRTYDPKLGRFMQADIVVQSPFDTQSYNRYSYLMNNPLNGRDPSGYFSIKENAGLIVGAVLTVWQPWGAGIWANIGYGATAGAAGAGANGGNILQGAAIGAFSAAVFSGINGPDSSLGWGASGDFGQHALNIAANGVAGGAISVVQGGKFGHGFASAGFSSAAGGALRSTNIGNPGVRVFAASIVGGTASVISGGKFANGAMTAAFMAATAEMASGDSQAEPEGRGLTAEERALAKASVIATHGTDEGTNYDTPRIVNGKYVFTQGKNYAVTPNGKIYYPNASDNMALDDPQLFVHEFEHIWQHQHGVNVLFRGFVLQSAKFLSLTLYEPYALPRGAPYSQLNIEQKSDYSVLQLFPNSTRVTFK